MKFYRSIYLFLLVAAAMLSACSDEPGNAVSKRDTDTNPKKEQPKKSQKKEAVKKKAKETPRKYPVINNDNVRSFLLQYGKNNTENKVRIKTKYGNIDVRLYRDTPLHRANFIYLTKQDFFNNTQFYRVTENFVVQGGDSDDFDFQDVKKDIGTYRIPNEIKPNRIHKFGAVAMAREYENNKEKKSSSFEFYIIIGEKHKISKLNAIEKEYQMEFTDREKEVYSTIGGTPHLDGQHTVFGEVISGMEVAEELSNLQTDSRDWPYETIMMEVEILE